MTEGLAGMFEGDSADMCLLHVSATVAKITEGVVVVFLHGFLTIKNIRIPIKKNVGDPPYPTHYVIFGRTSGGMNGTRLSRR